MRTHVHPEASVCAHVSPPCPLSRPLSKHTRVFAFPKFLPPSPVAGMVMHVWCKLEWQSFVAALQLPASFGWLLVSTRMLPLALKLLRKAGSAIAPVGHALTRLTMSPNALVGAVKDNVVPGVCTVRWCAGVRCRHP